MVSKNPFAAEPEAKLSGILNVRSSRHVLVLPQRVRFEEQSGIGLQIESMGVAKGGHKISSDSIFFIFYFRLKNLKTRGLSVF